MSNTTKITVEALWKLNSCSEQVELFAQFSSNGLELPDDNPGRQDVLDAAGRGGLNVARWIYNTRSSGIAKGWNDVGLLTYELRFDHGQLHDTDDGIAAWRGWSDAGQLIYEYHYSHGNLQDPEE